MVAVDAVPAGAGWIWASPPGVPGRGADAELYRPGVPALLDHASLIQRFESRNLGEFAKMLSAMRSEFNGHAEQKGSAGGTAGPAPLFHLPGRHFAFTFGRRPTPSNRHGADADINSLQ